MREYEFDGIDIDFEVQNRDEKELFIGFLQVNSNFLSNSVAILNFKMTAGYI